MKIHSTASVLWSGAGVVVGFVVGFRCAGFIIKAGAADGFGVVLLSRAICVAPLVDGAGAGVPWTFGLVLVVVLSVPLVEALPELAGAGVPWTFALVVLVVVSVALVEALLELAGAGVPWTLALVVVVVVSVALVEALPELAGAGVLLTTVVVVVVLFVPETCITITKHTYKIKNKLTFCI